MAMNANFEVARLTCNCSLTCRESVGMVGPRGDRLETLGKSISEEGNPKLEMLHVWSKTMRQYGRNPFGPTKVILGDGTIT